MSTIAIIDGGGANIASLRFALERLGASSILTTDHAVIRAADKVILPGVGAAAAAMQQLEAAGLDKLIPTLEQPLLGICLGMQLLFEASEEDNATCLGIIKGRARRFSPATDRPVPHMGWNSVMPVGTSELLADIPAGSYFYFVHSYALGLSDATAGSTEYGEAFTSVVRNKNFMGTQFHPERSGNYGAQLLQNFLQLRN